MRYRTPNANTSYMNIHYNHPTHTKKALLIMLNITINGLSIKKRCITNPNQYTIKSLGIKQSLNFERKTKVGPRNFKEKERSFTKIDL